jgi:hypothetical protein
MYMKPTENKTKLMDIIEEHVFAFTEYSDAELIAFYEKIRKAAIPKANLQEMEMPGLAGKFNKFLTCV